MMPPLEAVLTEVRDQLDPSAVETDSFVALGGHSLMAVRIVSALKRKYGIEARASDLLTAETLSSFADSIDESTT